MSYDPVNKALVLLTHVAAQMTYRWLPPPCPGGEPGEPGWDFGPNLPSAKEFWQALIGQQAALSRPRLPWLAKFLSGGEGSGERLAGSVAKEVQLAQTHGACFLFYGHAPYPEGWMHLTDPPAAVQYFGDVGLLSQPMVSVIGSRKASHLAARISFELGQALARRGAVVVSGGAFGCDIAAHAGVLAAQLTPAPAVCIFAGGLSSLYPAANRTAFARLSRDRALMMSERLWGAPCRALDFVTRNRLIAGLSPLTVVMQAAARSGALLTANAALDQGRDVAVLRHPAGDIRAAGGEALLTDGAWGFDSVDEFFEHANFAGPS